MKRSKYQSELAQVMDITESSGGVGPNYIPLIDLNPKEDALLPDGKKQETTPGTRRYFGGNHLPSPMLL